MPSRRRSVEASVGVQYEMVAASSPAGEETLTVVVSRNSNEKKKT